MRTHVNMEKPNPCVNLTQIPASNMVDHLEAQATSDQVKIIETRVSPVTEDPRDFGSFEDFEGVHHDQDLDRRCFYSLSGRTRDIAKYVSALMKEKYLYQDHKWYQFTGAYWRESTGPDELMTTHLVVMYKRLQQRYKSEKQSKWISSLIHDLGNSNRRRECIEDLERYDFNHSDKVKLDDRAELTGFQNGVFDAQECSFRPHRANDYLTKLLPYALPTDPDHDVRDQIERMISDMIPDTETRDFLMLILCLSLEGLNRHHIAMIWTGHEWDAQLLLKSLMKATFGDFHKEPRPKFLTYEDDSADLAELQGARSVFASGPAGKINSALLKHITGGDPVCGRALYSAVSTYVPRFLLTILCAAVPPFGRENEAIWRRIKIIHFRSLRHTTNPNPPVQNWGPQFMLMLIDRFRQYVQDKRKIYEPESISSMRHLYR